MTIRKTPYFNRAENYKILCPICKSRILISRKFTGKLKTYVYFFCSCFPIMSYNFQYFEMLRPEFIISDEKKSLEESVKLLQLKGVIETEATSNKQK